MKKNYLIISVIIIFNFFWTNKSNAELKDNLISKLKNIETLTFSFKQKISNKVQMGNCNIKYPKLIRCDYNDSYKKRLISNGRTLAIIQRRYKKIFLYPLRTTPLDYILDKKFLINHIKNNKPKKVGNILFKYEILKDDQKFIIFFDANSLNIKGWKTKDIYNNDIEFLISNLKINTPINKKNFKIPKEEDL